MGSAGASRLARDFMFYPTLWTMEPIIRLIHKENKFRDEGTMGDWRLATEAVEEEPSLPFAALGSHRSGYSLA